MDTRQYALSDWLTTQLGYQLISLEPASADASFRRYFRAQTTQGTFVAMDAPPNKEPLTPFINAANAIAGQQVHTPKIHHCNLEEGFLLLEDLGNRTYLDELSSNAEPLYQAAIAALIQLQQGYTQQPLVPCPAYDAQMLETEMDLFDQWYLQRHKQFSMHETQIVVWQALKKHLIEVCTSQPQTWVHRDYHSRNLMITEHNSPGVIDFQDMVIGPIAYDLASLFKDCYIRWPRAQQLHWLQDYHHAVQADFSFANLVRWYDFTGLQRHLKVLGIFCRLHYRDGKDQYLNDLPLVREYLVEVLSLYDELQDFRDAFSTLIAH